MAKYNPNSIWDSKNRKESDSYTPSNKPVPGVGSVPLYGKNAEENAAKEAAAKDAATKAAAAKTTPSTGSGPSKSPAKEPKVQEPFFKKTPVSNFDEEPPKSRALLWSAIVFFSLLAIGAVYFFFFRPTSGPSVTLSFTQPSQVLVGDSFPFSVSIANNSAQTLEGAVLEVLLPDNISFVGQAPDTRVLDETVGNIGPDSNVVNNQNFNLIVTGNPNSIQDVQAKLMYGTSATAQTQFTTDASSDLTVGNAALGLNMNVPQNVFSGQNFTITINYTNETQNDFNDVILNMQYPPVFSFTGSSMKPTGRGGNSWNLGTIPAGGGGTLTITGNVVGPNSAIYSIEGQLLGSVAGNTYPLNSETGNLVVGSSPLSVSISLNNVQNYIAQVNDALDYVVTYTNNSNTTFQNVNVKVGLVGAMFDFTTVNTNGSFNSINDTVTWNGANSPELLNLAPGQTGTLNLQIKTKANYPIKLPSDKDYYLNVTGQISSPTVPAGTTASSTVSVTSAQNQVGGEIALLSEGFWRDAANAIVNSGPYPPKVNKPTEYTIHWVITNYATDADNVMVSAYLQSGTTCTGLLRSNIPSSTPTCNSANGLVSWTIPRIAATTGVIGAPAQAIIQVTNTPAVNQVNQSVTLMGPTTLSATDDFTSSTLSATAGPVTTDLPYDKTISGTENKTVSQ